MIQNSFLWVGLYDVEAYVRVQLSGSCKNIYNYQGREAPEGIPTLT
jgi:hypothetical protein